MGTLMADIQHQGRFALAVEYILDTSRDTDPSTSPSFLPQWLIL